VSTPLLTTKLFTPPTRPELIPRPRLIEQLNKGLRHKLTLVSAPAGFGKTTLVSEWVRDCGCPVAWFSLDKNDNDLVRFLTYLIAALQQIDEDIGIDIQAALGESQSLNYEALLTKLVNEIESIPDKSIIVLDDYHLINSKAVHDALNFLIEYLPPLMHLVITGRADPPLPISRLRVRGEVSEIRTLKLRFTRDEAATFLIELMGLDLSLEDIAALEARTEGWVASLKLAALSMQGRDDLHEFISAFSGSNRYIIDYLVDEVMARHPEEVQVFLRRTSILERFCAPLCDMVVNGEERGDQEIIDFLDRSNLFLIPLDDNREWYRYHHLFCDFLRQRLREKESELIPELHRRASQWYEIGGLVDEAIQHALAAGDLKGATRLVDGIAASLVLGRNSIVLRNWVDQLPSDWRQDYPMLCVWYAWAMVFLWQLDAIEPILEIAEANQDKALGLPISGFMSVVRAYLASRMGDFQKAIDLSEQALEEMSGVSPDRNTLMFRGAAVIWLGVNHRLLGNLDRAREFFTEAVSLNREAGSIYAALSAIAQSADLAVIKGQLHQAMEIYQQGFQMIQGWPDDKGGGASTLVAGSGLHLGLGAVLYQINDLTGAAPHIQRAVELLELGEIKEIMHAYRKLAYLKQAEGDIEAAYDLLVLASSIRDNHKSIRSTMSEEPSLEQLRILFIHARPEMTHLLMDVAQRVETLGLQPDDKVNFSGADYPREIEYSDLARSLIALDRAAEALPLLERLLEGARSMGRQGDEIRYLVLTALTHHALEDMPSALDYLSQALTLAESQGYVRIFVDEGKPMWDLLNSLDLVSSTVSQTYVESLLEAFGEWTDAERRTTIGESSSLIEPLSERELEVLRLMTAGHRYKEVAEQLVISLNTVRHHTRNIYSKLNVNTRAQAIARVKELDLL
jgi:LuxR family maltose regulon positive regulatory protein